MKALELMGNIDWAMVAIFVVWLTAFVGAIIKYKIDMKVLQLKQKEHTDDIAEVKLSQHNRKKWALDLIKDEKAISERRFQNLENQNSDQHLRIMDKVDLLVTAINDLRVYIEQKTK